MSERLDVRRMLLQRGWTEDADGGLRKADAFWAAFNNSGDSGVGGPGRRGGRCSVAFDADVPARIIVATCEAAAEGVQR
jgi:hypothetical protein